MHKEKKKPMHKKKPRGMEIEIEIEHKHKKHEHHKPMKKNEKKIKKVMHEYGEGELHSGSKKGPRVTNPKQALAIAYSEAKRKRKKK